MGIGVCFIIHQNNIKFQWFQINGTSFIIKKIELYKMNYSDYQNKSKNLNYLPTQFFTIRKVMFYPKRQNQMQNWTAEQLLCCTVIPNETFSLPPRFLLI
jgi:hypothetical protein